MSVIIKGMEMPKNCAECKMWCICNCLNDFEDFESICYAVEDGDLIRDKNCPLTEIPTPHGRLGDLNELQEQIKLSAQDAHMSVLWKQGMAYAHGLVEASKTIIEAEGKNI